MVNSLLELDKKSPKHIIIAGDALKDHWVYGSLQPSQDGCEKFVATEHYWTSGGAANARSCLAHWNSSVLLCSQPEEQRGVKTRFLVNDRIVFRYDDERLVSSVAERSAALDRMKYCHAVLLCDYDKGFLTPEFITVAIAICTQRKIPCVVDAKREPTLYQEAILKCNEDYTNRYPKWWESHNAEFVQTLGAKSPVYRRSHMYDDTGFVPELAPVPCVNHVGAGDCFAAHLTLALAHGFDLHNSVAFAYAAGHVYVQRPRNSSPIPKEILTCYNP